jgi:hypothetical protein
LLCNLLRIAWQKAFLAAAQLKKRKWTGGTKLDIPENGRGSQPVKPEMP